MRIFWLLLLVVCGTFAAPTSSGDLTKLKRISGGGVSCPIGLKYPTDFKKFQLFQIGDLDLDLKVDKSLVTNGSQKKVLLEITDQGVSVNGNSVNRFIK
jgi:hypothetical protein